MTISDLLSGGIELQGHIRISCYDEETERYIDQFEGMNGCSIPEELFHRKIKYIYPGDDTLCIEIA